LYVLFSLQQQTAAWVEATAKAKASADANSPGKASTKADTARPGDTYLANRNFDRFRKSAGG
jgi:hypothetical protein